MIGKKVKVRVERVLNGTAYATLVQPQAKVADGPITAESEAEKPTRAPRKKAAEEPKAETEKPARAPRTKAAEKPAAKRPVRESGPVEGARGNREVPPTQEDAAGLEAVAEEPGIAEEEPPKPKKKTRRGSRGGRGRKKKPAAAAAAENGQAEQPVAAAATIHVPSPDLGKDGESEASADGEQPAAPKKKRTRRGSRGGRNRRKKSAAAQSDSGGSTPAS
jgi:ribonuclease E